jgi:hypothetical protein
VHVCVCEFLWRCSGTGGGGIGGISVGWVALRRAGGVVEGRYNTTTSTSHS